MHVAQNWRLNGQRYALKGVRCTHCGQAIFPPRTVCPHCRDTKTTADNITEFPVVALPVDLQRAGR
jgi:uncharacterized OB-fold protein